MNSILVAHIVKINGKQFFKDVVSVYVKPAHLSVLGPLPWRPPQVQVRSKHPHTVDLCQLLAAIRQRGAAEGRTEELLPQLLLDGATQRQAVGARPAGPGEQQGVHHGVVQGLVLRQAVAMDGKRPILSELQSAGSRRGGPGARMAVWQDSGIEEVPLPRGLPEGPQTPLLLTVRPPPPPSPLLSLIGYRKQLSQAQFLETSVPWLDGQTCLLCTSALTGESPSGTTWWGLEEPAGGARAGSPMGCPS